MSKKTDILDAIVGILEGVTSLKSVNWEKIKLTADDFKEYELPAAQIFSGGETIIHEQGRARKTWTLHLEIILKQSTSQVVNQRELYDLEHEVELALWENPQLGIPGVIDLRYVSNEQDLHLLDPIYYTRINFEARYYSPLVDDC